MSKCGDMVKFKLLDQASNLYEHFKLVTLKEQGRECYKVGLDKLREEGWAMAYKA